MVATMIAGAYFAAGTFAYAATVFAVNFAVSLIVTRMFGDNPETQQDMGVRQQVPPSAVNAIPIVYGTAYMGGTFVDAVLTTDQKTMYYVLAISSISPNGQFTYDTSDMYFGDRKITFDGTDLTKVVSLTDEAGNVDTKVSGNLYINLYKSTTGGTITSANGASAPSTVMGGSDIAVGQRWTGTRQMNGLGFAIVKLIYNRDADTTQLSPITFKVSHTLNGTGVAKAGDVWYDYMTNAVYGGAVDSAFVNSTSATALNAYGDQNITFTNSSGAPSTQPRYRINGVLDAGQSVLSNVDRIVSACDSWMTYNAALGQWSVVINKAESTAYAFNDNNIIGEIRVSATDITSSINQVEARFPFKENRDQAAFVNIETPSGLLYPNEPVNKYSITYDLVNDSVQAQYLANRLLEQAREDLIVGFSTTYYGIQVDAGDVVSVTNSDYGWNAKLFRVMKVNEASLPDGGLGARLELSEYNAQVYDDANITQFTPVPNSGLVSVSYFSPLATPTVTGFASATIPYIDVQVFVPTTGRVTFGNLFWTTSATPSAGDWKLVANASTTNGQPVTNGSYYTFANITLNTGTYYFAYNVGNDVTTSTLSPISAALVWNPIAGAGATGPTGATGASGSGGLNSATIYLYNKNTSTTPPALFSGTFTYTFATGVLSGGTLNGWSQTPPSIAAGEFLFLSLATASSTSATDSIPYTEFSTPEVISGTGTNGTNGSNTAIVSLFNKNTSAVTPPTTFSGTFTYTFSTAVLSGGTLNGWSQSAPTLTSGEYLWQRQATAFSSAATDTIAATEFSSAVVVGAAGATGATGGSGDSVDIVFKRSATQPATPSPSIGTPATWYSDVNSVPAGTDPIWSSVGTNTGTGTNYTWQTPLLVEGQNGTDGLSVAEVLIYIRATSTPTTPTGGSYNFTTQTLTAPSGWFSYVPTGTDPVYTSRSVASIQGTTGTDSTLTWSTPTLSFQNGATGSSGDSVDIIFKRSATQPTTPSPSVSTPATWYSDVNSVPAGSDPIWSSVGTNTGTGTNYTWQTPLLIEGQNGADGLSVAELLIYIRATSTPSTPTGGSYNFTTQTLTAPSGWYSYVPTGTDPVYTSRSVASIQGTTGTDSTLTWSTPTLSFQNGPTGPQGLSITGPNGLVGLSSLTAYLVQAQNLSAPTFTTPTTGATAPSGWSLTTPSVSVGQILWYIQGRYNANAVTVDGVGAGQTAWTGPVAASIFQDIRSDNWNGSTPPTYGSTGTYGTVGYYISQSTGNVYFNNGIFRGDITGASGSFSGSLNAATGTFAGSLTAASGTFNGDLITTGKLSLTGSGNVIAGYSVSQYINSSASYACIYANNTANASVATFYTGNARTIYAQNTSTFSGNAAIVGDNVGNGAGIQATGNTGTALIAFASSGNAFACQGAMTISSSTLVTNLNANYLQGNLASAFVTSTSGDAYAANRLNGSAGTNVLRFVQGTVTGTGIATFNASNKPASNSTNVWIEITIDGTTLYIPAWT